MRLGSGKCGSTKSLGGIPESGGLDFGRLQRGLLHRKGTGDGDQQGFGTRYWRCCSERGTAKTRASRRQPSPGAAPSCRPRVPERSRKHTSPTRVDAAQTESRAAGPCALPWGRGGRRISGACARHGRPLLIGRRWSRAGRPGVGDAPSQSPSNGT